MTQAQAYLNALDAQFREGLITGGVVVLELAQWSLIAFILFAMWRAYNADD